MSLTRLAAAINCVLNSWYSFIFQFVQSLIFRYYSCKLTSAHTYIRNTCYIIIAPPLVVAQLNCLHTYIYSTSRTTNWSSAADGCKPPVWSSKQTNQLPERIQVLHHAVDKLQCKRLQVFQRLSALSYFFVVVFAVSTVWCLLQR